TAAFSKAIAVGAPAADALAALVEAARAGAAATISMQALKGRASYLGPRSVGHEDPGAGPFRGGWRSGTPTVGHPGRAPPPPPGTGGRRPCRRGRGTVRTGAAA